MDNLDRQIVDLLQSNGRMTHEEISRLTHVSRPAIHQRVTRLERDGVIQGYRAIVDWYALGERIQAIIFVKLRCQDFAIAVQRMLSLRVDGVVVGECQRLAGEWCVMLRVRVADPRRITAFIDALVQDESISETSTTFILDTLLEDGIRQDNKQPQKGSVNT